MEASDDLFYMLILRDYIVSRWRFLTVEALRTLHLAHNCAIPFENLDVLLPREIQLDETALEEKLLYARTRWDTVFGTECTA